MGKASDTYDNLATCFRQPRLRQTGDSLTTWHDASLAQAFAYKLSACWSTSLSR